jgi:chitodextrinase
MSGTAPLRVRFTSQGSDPDGDRLTYAWDFGDDGTADTRNAWHTYTEPGDYTATVTVTDARGATGTAEVDIEVLEAPANGAPSVQAAADPGSGGAPLRVRFTSAGRDPDGDQLMYVWSFGDGVQAGGRNAVHTYTSPGTYTATVTVTDPDGATGTDTVEVTVTGPPQRTETAAPVTSAPAPLVDTGDVAGERGSASIVRPSSVRAFKARGLRLRLACDRTATGRATAKVSRATAKRLSLARRTVAAKRVRCAEGRRVSIRLKPSRAVARRLTTKRLRVTVRLAVRGSDALQRTLTIR